MKDRRRILGISQAKLAEKVSTSTHYIGQIELKNKFPTPEMLERIAAALEIDSPELFSTASLVTPSEALRQFQKAVHSDLEKATAIILADRVKELEGKLESR